MSFYLGIDVGTASVRAGLFDESGRLVGMGVRPIEIHRPQTDFAEQSSDDIWQAVRATVRTALSEAGASGEHVKGIGFDATCSTVALDDQERPVTVSPTGDDRWNVIMWMDHRAGAEADAINQGRFEFLKHVGGQISLEMHPPKLMWLAKRLPESYARTLRFLDLPDFLVYRATGRDVRSLCSTGCKQGYLAHERRWDEPLYQAAGIEDAVRAGKVGREIEPPGKLAGRLTDLSAQELGLSAECAVAVSIIDAHAGAIGCLGAMDNSDACLALIGGTSACLMALSREPRFVPGLWGPYFGAVLDGYWLNEGGQSAAGALMDYALEHGPGRLAERARAENRDPYEYANALVAKLQAGFDPPAALARHAHVYPDHHGNRSPHSDPRSKGQVDGLTLGGEPEDGAILYYATVQALAYNARDVIEALNAQGYRVNSLRVTGGSVKNPVWLQEHADATGCEVVVGEQPEAVLLGSAILGATAAGRFGTVREGMAAWAQPGETIRPNPSARAFHDAKFRQFQAMYRQHLERRRAMDEAG